jgi:hypothetical protein
VFGEGKVVFHLNLLPVIHTNAHFLLIFFFLDEKPYSVVGLVVHKEDSMNPWDRGKSLCRNRNSGDREIVCAGFLLWVGR